MKLVKRLLGMGLLAGVAYLVWKQWNDEAAGAAEWLATGPAEPTAPEPVEEKDPFEGQDPLTAPLPENL